MDQKEYDFGTRMCGDGREVVCSKSMSQELTHQAIDLHPVGTKNCRAHMVSSASGISTLGESLQWSALRSELSL